MKLSIAVTAEASGWRVEVSDETGAALVAERHLPRLGAGRVQFPLPPPEEADALSPGEPHYALCTATSPATIVQALARVMSGTNRPGEVLTFGRYLFTTLFGEQFWPRLAQELGGGRQVELALEWSGDEPEIHGLPWEMMHSPTRFLATIPGLAFSRRVTLQPGEATAPLVLTSPPRVLFVVGTDVEDQAVRPGAEYLGLLRDVGTRHAFRSHLLLQATPGSLEHAIRHFQPTMVHFIGHGSFDEHRRPVVYLRDPAAEGQSLAQTAAQFFELLARPGVPLVEVVVINACDSASFQGGGSPGDKPHTSPFAAELVKRGVPVVVGMAGQVADSACRLFTRQFYEAMLCAREIIQAVAEGRGAGIVRDTAMSPADTVDWALPVLFLRSNVAAPQVNAAAQRQYRNWQQAASNLPLERYPTFCGRLGILQQFHVLLASEGAQTEVWGRDSDLQVLAISTPAPTEAGWQYGRSRLLKEFARGAVLDGHVPCLVNEDSMRNQQSPKTAESLWECLVGALYDTRSLLGDLGLTCPFEAMLQLDNWSPGGAADGLHPDLVEQLVHRKRPRDHPSVRGTAFRIDVLRLLNACRQFRPPVERADTRFLLLIDNVHEMDEAPRLLLREYLGRDGLRAANNDVRVVLTYAAAPPSEQASTVVDVIKPWVEGFTWVAPLTLKEFREPEEERQAYLQFLLRYQDADRKPRPLTVARRRDAKYDEVVDFVVKKLRQKVKGVPSNLAIHAPAEIEELLDVPPWYATLQEADDEQALRSFRQLL